MPDQVLRAFFEDDQIFFGVCVCKGLSRSDFGSSPVHFQRACCRHDDHGIRGQSANPALDVAELFHAHVGTKATLGENISDVPRRVALFCTYELQRDAVGQDGRVAMSDVGEGPSVYKDGCALECLHEVGLDRVFQENRKSAANTEVVGRDSVAMLARRDYHCAKTLTHVLQTRG
jgi:hypothetical protein